MGRQPESPLLSFGAGLCLHPPGCCPAGSVCFVETRTELALPSTASLLTKEFLAPCDATELHAREILCSAQREVAEQQERPELAAVSAAKSATAAYPRDAALGLSMKGSLRRFLEKRAARLRQASASPYTTLEKLQSACSLR